MAAFSYNINLANFTCKFGERIVLLDLFEEVVWPSFKDKRTRTFADSSYFFIDVELRRFPDDELAIVGRIVKNTVLTRDQVFIDGKIVKDFAQLDSAPTSFFTLLLSNHKLLYVRENVGAPSLDTFASTISAFLGASYKKWIRKVYDEKNKNTKITWSELQKDFPPPKLEITAMGTESSVSAYVEKFTIINTVEIKLIDTNHELDNLPIFEDMREIQEKVGATDIALRTHKRGDVGMNKNGVAKLVSTPAQEGNSKIVIRGKGLGGGKLVAKNDSFNVAIPISDIPKDPGAAAVAVRDKLSEQISLGIINLKSGGAKAMQKIAGIISDRKWH